MRWLCLFWIGGGQDQMALKALSYTQRVLDEEEELPLLDIASEDEDIETTHLVQDKDLFVIDKVLLTVMIYRRIRVLHALKKGKEATWHDFESAVMDSDQHAPVHKIRTAWPVLDKIRKLLCEDALTTERIITLSGKLWTLLTDIHS